jgi:formylglycine-generating enzyme required for sulfatase activity
MIFFVMINLLCLWLFDSPAMAGVVDADCPAMPSCPGETGVPLPPIPEKLPEAPIPRAKPPAPAQVVEGAGNYENMILVKTGGFELGSPDNEGGVDEHPLRKIFTKDYYFAKSPITAGLFCAFLNKEGDKSKDGSARVNPDCPDCPVSRTAKGYAPKDGCDNKPMVCVSWLGASEYAEWVGARLPTSAEWEKAALLMPADAGKLANSRDASRDDLYPLSGNEVWEWCYDWYERDYYAVSPSSNPPGPNLGLEKVIRGGSRFAADFSRRIRNRHKAGPQGCYRTVGFRIVKD